MRSLVITALFLTACGGMSATGVTIVQAPCAQQADGSWTATAKVPSGFDEAKGDFVIAEFCDPKIACAPGDNCSGDTIVIAATGKAPPQCQQQPFGPLIMGDVASSECDSLPYGERVLGPDGSPDQTYATKVIASTVIFRFQQ